MSMNQQESWIFSYINIKRCYKIFHDLINNNRFNPINLIVESGKSGDVEGVWKDMTGKGNQERVSTTIGWSILFLLR